MRVENLEASNRGRLFAHSNDENAELASEQVGRFSFTRARCGGMLNQLLTRGGSTTDGRS